MRRLDERLEALLEVLDERLGLVLYGALCAESQAGLGIEGLAARRGVRLELPPSIRRFVAEVLAFAERRGLVELDAILLMLYGETMPFSLSLQLAGADGRCPWLFSTPLSLGGMPRLRSALEQLDRALAHGQEARGLALVRPFVWQRWLDGAPMTLAELHRETYFGGLQPLFGTTPEVLAELAKVPEARRAEAVDRVLGPALLHEFLHFGRERDALMPPYLDECIAGALGVWLDPRTALPEDDTSEALEGFATFSQVGERLVEVIGREPVLMAQAGFLRWDEVLPPGARDAIADLYWRLFAQDPAPHLHPDPHRPEPWAELFAGWAPALSPSSPSSPAALRRSLVSAIAAFGLTRTRPGFVRRGPPPATLLDFERGLARPEGEPPHAPRVQLIPKLPLGVRRIAPADAFGDLERRVEALIEELQGRSRESPASPTTGDVRP